MIALSSLLPLLLPLAPSLAQGILESFTSGLSDWKRAPEALRCRPGISTEKKTCRRRTILGAETATLALSGSLRAGVTISVPVPELDTEAVFYVPFSYRFYEQEVFNLTAALGREAGEGREAEVEGRKAVVEGRNFRERKELYTKLEGLLGSVSSSDGHSCLLRAMCEAGAVPLHGDGLLGDVLNLVLAAGQAVSGSLSGQEFGEDYSVYSRAEAAGRDSGDCSSYHQRCPLSFFDSLGESANSI